MEDRNYPDWRDGDYSDDKAAPLAETDREVPVTVIHSVYFLRSSGQKEKPQRKPAVAVGAGRG